MCCFSRLRQFTLFGGALLSCGMTGQAAMAQGFRNVDDSSLFIRSEGYSLDGSGLGEIVRNPVNFYNIEHLTGSARFTFDGEFSADFDMEAGGFDPTRENTVLFADGVAVANVDNGIDDGVGQAILSMTWDFRGAYQPTLVDSFTFAILEFATEDVLFNFADHGPVGTDVRIAVSEDTPIAMLWDVFHGTHLDGDQLRSSLSIRVVPSPATALVLAGSAGIAASRRRRV